MTLAFDVDSASQEAVGTQRAYNTTMVLATTAAGIALGVAVPNQTNVPQPWATISACVGWTYFVTWSISFYPQIIVNYRRKSVIGLSFDFVLLNFLGFLSYVAYTCTLYADVDVRETYRARHHGQGNGVRMNDVIFALHACVVTAVVIGQCCIYERGSQRVSKTCLVVSTGLVLGCCGLLATAQSSMFPGVQTLDFMYVIGYIKVAITCAKYAPQVWLNFQRQSTDGFAILPVLCDITGSWLSLAQQALDSFALGDWSVMTGNSVKLGIAAVSIAYDIILMVQHYIIYPEAVAAVLPQQREGFKPIPADDRDSLPGFMQRPLASAATDQLLHTER